METLGKEVLETLIYGGVGLIIMFIAMFVFDLVVPYNFNQELKEKNVASGFIIAGLFIATAIIIRTVIM
ncbi:MAG: DUF350 domain-containing protein [Clostridia bacterium]|nr:DUF350 domain-containing protein [Clostridia bacterium]